ncbi:uncharacterized protein [Osmerus mordax]|uniref:uncharacterized protein n=1 Tax=Osmerus mordax TaxID=8014 RepID=UPI003510915E
MGQLVSSAGERSEAQSALGSLLYNAMLEQGALPDLGVDHSFLGNPESKESQAHLQAHLQELQGHMGNRAPAYLKELISRLVAFSEEPRVAALVGLVVSMVLETAYVSSCRGSSRGSTSKAKSQVEERRAELCDMMEEYLKRCRMHLSEREKLHQDTLRLEGQLSLLLTQLKSSLLREGCSSRGLKHWASGAALHTHMLVHLAGLEQKGEPLAALAALEQYHEDMEDLIPAYRRYKAGTVSVVKSHGGLCVGGDPQSEGCVTGLTLVDRETGRSVSVTVPEDVPYSPDLVTSDQLTQAYLDLLLSPQGPLVDLHRYFTSARDRLGTLGAGRAGLEEQLSIVETEPLARGELNTHL